MRASNGLYYAKLDHFRTLAAFMVFTWHFTHYQDIIPPGYLPSFVPFSIFEEGYGGVTLFMTLSGYLFAKIIDSKEVNYFAFLWNRLIRLAPLLVAVLAIAYTSQYYKGRGKEIIVKELFTGLALPVWPNGGWSIAVELHFYLMLPLFLHLTRRKPQNIMYFISVAILIRYAIYVYYGQVQTFAYSTIIGRFDQFALGIFFFYGMRHIKPSAPMFLCSSVIFLAMIYTINYQGGFLTSRPILQKALYGYFSSRLRRHTTPI